MKKIRMFVALSATLLQLLAGFALTSGVAKSAPVQCKGSGICQIPIDVTVDSNNQCSVQVEPDVTAAKAQKRIQWSINALNPAAQGVFFVPGKGIDFTDPDGWNLSPIGANAKRATATPSKPHAGAYYSIYMQWTVGPTTYPCDFDPIINNDF